MKLPLIVIGIMPRSLWRRLSRHNIQRLRAEANEAARKEWVTEQRASLAELDDTMRQVGLPAITDEPHSPRR